MHCNKTVAKQVNKIKVSWLIIGIVFHKNSWEITVDANLRGAFDLSQFAQSEQNSNESTQNTVADQQPQMPVPPAQNIQGGAFGVNKNADIPTTVEADDSNLQVVVNQSTKYPIILSIWSAQFEQCRDFNAMFERVAAQYGGRFQLVKIQIDNNPATQKIFKVESVPYVIALINGGMAPLFTGAMDEAGLREAIDQVLAACLENGVVGTAEYLPVVENEVPAEHQKAMQAFEEGDYDAAQAAWELALRKDPKDHTAKVGLADLRLRRRIKDDSDFEALIQASKNAKDTDFETKFKGADAQLVMGDIQGALDTWLQIVLHGDEQTQEEARQRLIDAFDMLGPIEEVNKARRILASYLI